MNKPNKTWTLFFGIVTALVIVFTQLFWFQSTDIKSSKVDTEQAADADSTEEAHISLPSSSIPASTSVEVGQGPSFIQEILFQQESESQASSHLPNAIGKFFQTLFRVTIAPNAP